jgi:hydroxyethylthiazole kinase-like sugar kinase family protein
MTRGIAHVSFGGGGIVLPARSPYERQLLAEHVQSRVRANGEVQVVIDDQRWMVRRRPRSGLAECSQCGCAVNSACYLGAGTGTPYCLACAFGARADLAQSQVMAQQRMSS